VVFPLPGSPHTDKYGTTESRSAKQVVRMNAVTRKLYSVLRSTYLSIAPIICMNSSPIGGQGFTIVGRRRAETTVGSRLGTTRRLHIRRCVLIARFRRAKPNTLDFQAGDCSESGRPFDRRAR
jgi:hypothetical protein